jgi:dTDP-4-dehydrorhamnose reductase
MKVAVIGALGQLGTDLCEAFGRGHQVAALDVDQLDIADIDRSRSALAAVKPDLVLNTAAFHNVPKCEEDPAMSFRVNGQGALNLAKLSDELGYALVHYSTDYVFDGAKRLPYVEGDAPNPLNVYAVTKLAGEHLVRNYCRRHFVVRISGIYGKTPCRAKGGNFVTTMLKAAKEKPEVRVVEDEVLTPTPTREIARNTLALAGTDAYGLYHMTCEGACSWYEFARVIFDTLQLKTPLRPCSVADFPSPVKRPFYSVLENAQLKAIGKNQMPFWKDALISYLRDTYPRGVQ